ncbi:FHA domain-containing protein [Hyalangium versicolor]|uniref:FHA domain-containing protein n=1 Tax=Hyalangium versicolor TaxID=2861190 RepID=UPI001CCBCED4|nr:FHA domain-containing protein [Hyalangium versicolor]
MLKLIIEDDEGRKTVVPFVREEITIGRQEGNTIRLTERNVSRRHARLMRLNGHVVVEDLGSSNGTRINGERISGQSQVKDGDLIQIGDYDLALQSDAAMAAGAPPKARPAPVPEEPSDADHHSEPETETESPVEEDSTPSAERRHSTAIIKMDHVEGNRNRKVRELEAEEAPRLVVVSAEFKGQEYACIRTEMKIGRTDDNDIVIDHRSLSRTHAKVVREDNGEWRILDMQSANGLTVNGDTYAQAPLNNGDVIELGHVKMRFVAAGEATGSVGAAGRSKLPLVLALLVLVVAGGTAAAWALKVGPFKDDAPQRPPEITQQPPPPPPPDPGQQPQPPEPSPGTDTPPPETAVAADTPQVHLKAADGALQICDLETVAAELKKVSGPPSAEGKALGEKLQAEQKAMDAIGEAQKLLTDKKYDEALKKAAPAQNSACSREAYTQLQNDVQAAKAPPKVETAKTPPPPPPTNKPPPAQPAADAQEQAQATYDDAARALRAKQYDSALTLASKCVSLVPDKAECHMLLGAAYAGLSQWDKAATHYRKFLDLAPDHKMAPKVRQTVDAYEQSKKSSN